MWLQRILNRKTVIQGRMQSLVIIPTRHIRRIHHKAALDKQTASVKKLDFDAFTRCLRNGIIVCGSFTTQ